MAVKNSPDLSMGGIKSVRKKLSKALNLDSKGASSTSSENSSPNRRKSVQDTTFKPGEEIRPLELNIHYLGYADIKSPGYDDLCVQVNDMYTKAKPYLKTLDRAQLTLSRAGIVVRTHEEILYKARRVLFCGVDKQHQRVFSFNYQHGLRAENIHLHVLVCKSKEEARLVAKYLAQVFKRNSKDQHKREREEKKIHSETLSRLSSRTSQSAMTYPKYSNLYYPESSKSGSQDNTCGSGTCGSAEWTPDDRVLSQLSVA